MLIYIIFIYTYILLINIIERIKKVKMQTSISSSDKSEIKNLHQVINTNNNNTIITNNTTNNEESNDNNDNDL